MSSTYPSEDSSSADINSLVVVTSIAQICGPVLSVYKLRSSNKRHKRYHISSTGNADLEDDKSESNGQA